MRRGALLPNWRAHVRAKRRASSLVRRTVPIRMRTTHTNNVLHRPITLLVVDDNPAVRRGLRCRLEFETDLVVLGEAADGHEALDKLQQFAPDVVILDVEMPVMDGLSVAARLRADGRRTRSVVLTVHDDSATRARAHAASVDRFVSKTNGAESLLSAIRQAGQAA